MHIKPRSFRPALKQQGFDAASIVMTLGALIVPTLMAIFGDYSLLEILIVWALITIIAELGNIKNLLRKG